jgi:hypothetical protein
MPMVCLLFVRRGADLSAPDGLLNVSDDVLINNIAAMADSRSRSRRSKPILLWLAC